MCVSVLVLHVSLGICYPAYLHVLYNIQYTWMDECEVQVEADKAWFSVKLLETNWCLGSVLCGFWQVIDLKAA